MEGSNVKIDGKDYTLPSSWLHLKVGEYMAIVSCQDKPPLERLSVYSGVPLEVLNKCTLNQLAYLSDALAWMDDYEDCLLFVKVYKDGLSIDANTYEKIEMAKLALKGKPLLALSRLVELYYGELIDNALCVDSLGKGLHVLAKIDEFLKKFPELYEYEPTPQEVEAGVEDIAKLGAFYTVKKMAEKFQKHPNEILQWEAGVVYKFLQADAIDARISRNLQKIASRKK